MRSHLATLGICFGLGLGLGALVGRAAVGEASPSEARLVPPDQSTDPARRAERAPWIELRDAKQAGIRAEVERAGPGVWDGKVPAAQGGSAVDQRLQQVDDRIGGPGLPHGARFLDHDCSRLPCTFVLAIPGDGLPSRGPGPRVRSEEDLAVRREVERAFREWLDLGELFYGSANSGPTGERLLSGFLMPPGLTHEERAQIRADLQDRQARMLTP